jgi:MYXO-CTERM domain-containing protein
MTKNKNKLIFAIAAACVALASSTQANPAYLYDTLQDTLTDTPGSTKLQLATQSLTVPSGQIWSITDMQADVSQDSDAYVFFSFYNSSDTLLAKTDGGGPIGFVGGYATVDCPVTVVLDAGTYTIKPSIQLVPYGYDAGSDWIYNVSQSSFDFALSGTSVPEPSTMALETLALAGLGGLALLRRKRK